MDTCTPLAIARAAVKAVPSTPRSEKRKHHRQSCRIKVRYRQIIGLGLFHQDEVYIDGTMLNKSRRGVLVETLRLIPQGQQVELSFQSPSRKNTFLVVGVVRWARQMRNSTFHIGIKIEDLRAF